MQHPDFNVTLIVTPANIDGNVAMGNTTSRLTNTLVKQSKVREKEYNLADGDGLYLRVRPSGTRSWLFNYPRPFSKQRTNLSLGKYPYLSLADARSEAQVFKHLLAKDVDPKAEQTRNNTGNQRQPYWYRYNYENNCGNL